MFLYLKIPITCMLMRAVIIYYFCFFVLMDYSSFGQNIINSDSSDVHQFIDEIKENAVQYKSKHPVEKIYLQFDKPYYSLGEICWFKIYLVNRMDLYPSEISGIANVDIISPEDHLLKHLQYKVQNGESNGDFNFEMKWPEGNYKISAYTEWMRNDDPAYFFHKNIQVINASSSGGRVSGIETTGKKTDLQSQVRNSF